MSESYSRAANLLGALALAVSDRLREATEDPGGGLAASEPAALVTLASYPGQSVVALSRTLGLTHSGAVRLAGRMEAAGLVRRAPAGHGRTLAIHLTPSGAAAAALVLARRQAAIEQLLVALDPGEAEALASLAGRMLAGITTDRGSAHQICRLCDEQLCVRDTTCPVDQAVRG